MKQALKSLIWSALLVAPLVAVGLGAAGVDEGKAVFDKRCKMCHGADGKGNPAMARMLQVQFHPMDSEYVQKLTDEEIKNTVLKGKGKMAAVRGITESEITQVTAYLRSLKK